MEEKIFEGIKYLISYPEEFQEDKKYPLVIFLHGAGTRGENIERLQKNVCFLALRKRQDARGYILLAPLCQNGDWFAWMTPLLRLVGEIRELPYIDETRLHVTGVSMGGYGTWEFSSLRPDWVATAMPICGGGIAGFAQNLVDVPIRTFHGLRDQTVDPIESLQMAKAVNRKGGHAELILFPELAHNCWDTVYSDERNYDWLLSFTTKRDKTLVEALSGDYYG
jgi:predicted peptidase